jgi:hypothetical protein
VLLVVMALGKARGRWIVREAWASVFIASALPSQLRAA